MVFAKSLQEVKSEENTVVIIVDDSEIDNNKIKLKLNLTNDDKLPLKMVYLAAQINNLNKIEN